uniref:Uncharacterized protein n=1 Tax=Equus asinus asinus TaxID=83772 RepID=A0A8C4LJZ9_EQUAS
MCKAPISLSHTDLSKAARDIFNKRFDLGLVKLDVKTNSCRKETNTVGHYYWSYLTGKNE